MTTPLFQHRHYVAVAKAIAAMPDAAGALKAMAVLSDLFARDNPQFNRDRFIAAASGNPTNGKDR